MKIDHLFISVLVISGLLSCQNHDTNKARKPATSSVDSLSDTARQTRDYTTDIPLTSDVRSFIIPAAIGGMMEVEAANFVLQKSGNKSVKEFAALMLKDHTKANHDLEGVAKKKGIALPGMLPDEQMKDMTKMKELSGRSLDVYYITMMIHDHASTEAMFKQASIRFDDADLKSFLKNTLPVIQGHHKMADKLGKDLNITNANNGDDFPNVRPDTLQ